MFGPVQAEKQDNPKLPEGVQIVKSDICGLECPWYFVRGEMVWSKREGWKPNYEGNRDDCYFKSTEEAMEAWTHDNSACEPTLHRAEYREP